MILSPRLAKRTLARRRVFLLARALSLSLSLSELLSCIYQNITTECLPPLYVILYGSNTVSRASQPFLRARFRGESHPPLGRSTEYEYPALTTLSIFLKSTKNPTNSKTPLQDTSRDRSQSFALSVRLAIASPSVRRPFLHSAKRHTRLIYNYDRNKSPETGKSVFYRKIHAFRQG